MTKCSDLYEIIHPSLDLNSLCLLSGAENLLGVRMLLKPYYMRLLDVNDKSKREIDSVICGQVKSFRGHWLLCLKNRSPVEKASHGECGVVGFIFKLFWRY